MKKVLKWAIFSGTLFIVLFSVWFFATVIADIDSLINPITLVIPLITSVTLNLGCIFLCKFGADFALEKFNKKILIVALSLILGAMVLFAIGKSVNTQIAKDNNTVRSELTSGQSL